MLLASLSLLASLQGASDSAVAIKNDNPETWTVEYPRLIRPFVVEYRKCLNVSDRRVTGSADFEMQHRSDVPRCEKAAEKAKAQSNEAMRGAKTALSPAEVDQLFGDIGLIHIARGRDLDDQFRQRVAAAAAAKERYEETRPRGLVIELRDASVVKARTDANPQPASETKDLPNAEN